MSLGLRSAFIGCALGAIIGTVADFFGGKIDLVIQRFIDILLSFPIIVMAIIVIAVVPKNVVLGIDVNVIVAIAIPFIPKVARVIRSAALTIVTLPYIDAARALGFTPTRKIGRAHV